MSPTVITKIILAMFLWAACFPLITAGLQYAPHLTFATMRAVLAGAALVGLAMILRRPFPRGWRTWVTLGVVGLGATSLGFLGMFHAAEFVSPGLATVIANTQPLLAAMLGVAWLGERLPRIGWIGLLVGFAGILVIALPQLLDEGQEGSAIGFAYIVLAAVGVTISNVAIKSIADKADGLFAMGLQLLIGSVPLAFAAFALEDQFDIQWNAVFTASLLGLALFGSALVYWIWFSVLEEVELNRAIVFSFLVPIFGLSIGALFFGERLSGAQFSGIALVILGIVFVNLKGARRAQG
ncbi:Threonine/homoserine efflux transporter RhtA [Cribrihabitans marinus]|uniref:Threonine/homoserine efflux transporter RhtA n=1 Tax=Cribrihabitans marinus TaxID=1227549 RepID=A0A1H7DBJ5_9RHOB|nr:DMT family transporter [Cribrihabitans marinus]GGH38510.1 peptide ABC transporter permease [Cribrihabitans marinus]SEJ99058.1 Threonine/homoserine efflux transporter RhtA [Cribrihabitans marinus]